MRIALAGNPNSGKTTMFNALTGRHERVGNWAGVTVDMKEHSIRKRYRVAQEELIAVDLPGAYSMSPFTSEESVTRDYIQRQRPDVILNIVDATNLSRSLFFTTQLLELGIPTVVALNKADLNRKKQTQIDTALLSERLGCPVIDTVSTSADGLREVMAAVSARVGEVQTAPYTDGVFDPQNRAEAEEADRRRFAFVNALVEAVESRCILTRERNVQDKIDALLTNRYLGLPIFAAVMFAVFWISQAGPGVWIADALVAWLEMGQEALAGLFENADPLLQALLIDGIVGGVIAVIGFLPLVMVMYFLIALLEDCGYMARATVVLDPIFKRVGLSGRSVIPFVIGTGCAIPGVMACRTIRDERERRATAMLAPLMPCGAKLPVISLFAGAFFADASWVGPLMYFTGILLIFLGALLVNKVAGYRVRKSFFIIELPEYKWPSLWRAFTSMCSRGWAYIVKAATVILLCNTAVQIMQSFTPTLQVAQSADASILAYVARPVAYLLIPVVGVLSWQMAAAAVTGFIAKENVVGTLAVCFVGLENLIDTEALEMMEGAGASVAAAFAITKAAALAYLMFNLYTPPCFAAIAAMSAEMKSGKWFWAGIGLQLCIGYTVGFTVYQVGTLIGEGHIGAGFVPGLIAVLAMAAFIVLLGLRSARRNKAEHAKKQASQVGAC